jgi:hypothetical protein
MIYAVHSLATVSKSKSMAGEREKQPHLHKKSLQCVTVDFVRKRALFADSRSGFHVR